MSELESAWSTLLHEARTEPGWHGRRVHIGAPCRIQAAVRSSPRGRGLLFEVPALAVPAAVDYPACAGFALEPESVSGGPGGVVRLVLTERAAAYADLFSAMAADVVRRVELAPDGTAAVTALLARLTIWQRFASRFGPGHLGDEACVGLAAELLFLERQLRADLPAAAGLASWVGPAGAPQDFRFSRCLVEVKGSMSQTPVSFRVSSLEQLDGIAGVPLFLCHLSLTAAGSGARPLPVIVADVRTVVQAAGDGALERLEELLMEVGYLDEHAVRYLHPPYAARAAVFHRVEEGFPRITPQTVPSGVLGGIYSVSLAACAPWIVPESECLALIESDHA